MRVRHTLLLLGGLLAPCLILPALAEHKAGQNARPVDQDLVTLNVRTVPRVKARVFWGRKLLGETPLTLKWPRDSGPLDIVVDARGYLPVNTRLYTFGNDTIHVKLLADTDKQKLFGYRRPPPDAGPPQGGPPDGGTH